MPQIETIFWGWDSPLIDKAVEWLSRGTDKDHALDLSDTVVVVPTAEASRRLREALATAASKRGKAVMVPWVWHPEQCLLTEADRRRTATNAQNLLAWIRVMQEADLARLPKLFPSVPERQSAAWAADMARTMIDLQAALGAGGLSFADVVTNDHASTDRQRWSELAELERAFDKVIAARGVVALQWIKRERAHAPVLPPDVKRICVIGVADAPPLFSRWLMNAATSCDVVVCVQAPELKRGAFSTTGQPLVSHWGEKAAVIVPLAESRLHLETDSAAQARKAAELLPQLLHHGRTAVGVCDAETSAHLLDRLEAEDVKAYEPGGRAAGQHGFLQLVRLWRDLVDTESWKPFAALLRLPDFAAALGSPHLLGVSLLRAADDFADKRLPIDLRSAQTLLDEKADEKESQRWSPVLRAVGTALSMISAFKRQSLPEAVRGWLVQIYGSHPFRSDQPRERDLMKLATSWIQIADSLAADASRVGARLNNTEALRLSIELLADAKLSDPRGDIDLVIQGWLELLWEPAPYLVVLGCNEENLPGIFISHPFLPDRLRESLGLPCQATRYARDAYLLHAMASQREKNGALHLLCGQWSERGDALRPSRLLFLCDDKQLAHRVSHLFPKDGVESADQQPPRTWLWKLKPRAIEARADDTISVSRLNDYLACPFRYYLRRELGMEAIDPTKAEMSAAEFGSLIHVAFKALAGDASMRDCLDEEEIAKFLAEHAQQEAERIFGARLPFTVRLQLDSAIQRLEAAAAFEAAHRAEGWRTLHGEIDIGGEQDSHPFQIGGRRLKGTIDRVDERGDEVLILDFKTSETAKTPEDAHLARLTRGSGEIDEWRAHPNGDGKACRWMDLQLPLYVRAWSLRHRGPIRAGYFHLPTNVQETRISIWETLDQTALDAALRCAEEAVARLDRRIHWPPNEDVRFDDFADLFGGHSIEDVVDASEILKLEVTT